MSKALKKAEIGFVPSRWDVGPLVTFLDKITYGFTNPMPDAVSGPWKLTAKDVVDGRINYETARHTTQEAFEKDLTEKSKPRIDDVLLTKDGSIGRVAVVDREGICINQSVALLRPNERILPHFLKYLLLTPHYQEVMERDSDGSTIKHIYITRVDKMEVAVPPIDEQGDILDTLKAIDDKIELNRRMNETLGAMARAIFKSWFVDFDPVRAKASREPPESICCRLGLTVDVLALFPDSFQNSELGEIPAGWASSTIGSLATIVGGSTPNTKEPGYWENGIHYWATPKDLSGLSSSVLLQTERMISNEGLAQIGSGLLEPGTVLLSSRAPIGYRAINEIPVAINQGFIAMKPNEGISKYFLLYWAEHAHDEIVSRANGSTFLEISKSNFRPIPVVRPSDEVIERFDLLTEPLHRHVVSNDRETLLLTEQRDSLLPNLLSGRIVVTAEGSKS